MPGVPQCDRCHGMGASRLDECLNLGSTACVSGFDTQAALHRLQAGTLAAAIAATDEVDMGPAAHLYLSMEQGDIKHGNKNSSLSPSFTPPDTRALLETHGQTGQLYKFDAGLTDCLLHCILCTTPTV